MAKPKTLLDLCDAAGLSAAQVASALGVNRATVYVWSAKQARPADDRIVPLAALLKTSVETVRGVLAPYRKPGAPRKH